MVMVMMSGDGDGDDNEVMFDDGLIIICYLYWFWQNFITGLRRNFTEKYSEHVLNILPCVC